jgi:hypothetical protein
MISANPGPSLSITAIAEHAMDQIPFKSTATDQQVKQPSMKYLTKFLKILGVSLTLVLLPFSLFFWSS